MEQKNKKGNNKFLLLTILLVALIGIVSILSIYLIKQSKEKEENTIAYTDLIKELSYGNIEKIEMTIGSSTVKVNIKNNDKEKSAIIPNTEAFIELVQEKVDEGNDIKLIQKSQSILVKIPSTLLSLFPTIIMLVLCVGVLAVGVFALTPSVNTISGSLGVGSSPYEIGIEAYKYKQAFWLHPSVHSLKRKGSRQCNSYIQRCFRQS